MAGHCVLASGGLDSALVLHRVARDHGSDVHPVFVRFGFRWEAAELDHLGQLVADVDGVRGVSVLESPVDDVYTDHWAMAGPVPDADSHDEAVEIPGRNLLILAKAGLYADAEGLDTIWHGTLGRNPFADATTGFFDAMTTALSEGFEREVGIRRPLTDARKVDVIQELAGTEVALEHTFSCLDPVDGRHCGACNKCAERREAFADAGVEDPTRYVDPMPI